ncbi:hypothetical protein EYF80_058448 [Liparis tanakae]|uniref:Uncharacterized protein n=1 Tax=Liparis tanakae TaxID=230148 RepID=A0A4Z2ERC3_9TELE|nr:hypothetical protein EYF80_058448 [Liparis tanakae]
MLASYTSPLCIWTCNGEQQLNASRLNAGSAPPVLFLLVSFHPAVRWNPFQYDSVAVVTTGPEGRAYLEVLLAGQRRAAGHHVGVGHDQPVVRHHEARAAGQRDGASEERMPVKRGESALIGRQPDL